MDTLKMLDAARLKMEVAKNAVVQAQVRARKEPTPENRAVVRLLDDAFFLALQEYDAAREAAKQEWAVAHE